MTPSVEYILLASNVSNDPAQRLTISGIFDRITAQGGFPALASPFQIVTKVINMEPDKEETVRLLIATGDNPPIVNHTETIKTPKGSVHQLITTINGLVIPAAGEYTVTAKLERYGVEASTKLYVDVIETGSMASYTLPNGRSLTQ
jgi:hypothetical protein